MEKHLHYYTQHSQYSEPTNKPAVSYCELEDEVHYAATESVTLITFTAGGTSYQAEEGMTWQQWVNSSYNTGGFYIDNNGIYAPENAQVFDRYNIDAIRPQDAIIANYSYVVYSGGTGTFD